MKEKGKMKSEKVWTSLLLTFSLLLFTSAAQAENEVNASHCFLSLTGIDGDSKDLNHEMWIDAMWIYVIDARFDSSESEMTDILEVADGRDGAGMVKIQLLVSSAPTKIRDAYVRGTIIDGGCINVYKPIGGQQDLVLSYILEGVKVVKSEIEVENLPTGEFVLVEKYDLSVEKIIKNEEGVSPREVSVGDHSHLTAAYTSGRGTVTNAIDGMSFKVPAGTKHVKVIFAAEPGWEIVGDAVVEIETVIKNIVFGEESGYRVPEVRDTSNYIPYRDYDASTGTFTNAVRECTLVTSETRVLESGWYAVKEEVVFPLDANLTVNGDAHLILCDGASLTVTNGLESCAAVEVAKSLTICGQAGNTGTLTAQGRPGGAGIGGGNGGDGGTVTINGGTVTARGGDRESGLGYGGAGIGGGWYGAGGTVTIRGGRVTAQGGGESEDIGRGEDAQGGSTVAISGGVFARELKTEWLAPGCKVVANEDEATREKYPWAVARQPDVTVTVDDFPRGIIKWTSGDGSVTNVVEDGAFKVKWGTENVMVFFTAKPGYELVGETVVDIGTVTADVAFGSDGDYKVPNSRVAPVEYVDADGVVQVRTNREFSRVTSSTKKFADGKWYAVIDDVVLTDSIIVEGTAHLILCDWATLAITNSSDDATVSVVDGKSLTIYGQTANTGRLEVKNGKSAAGIGGNYNGTCGAITIHGGAVKAEGGTFSAGIGCGMLGGGGSVTITGGRIWATGNNNASDIGDAYRSTTHCSVSISGGIFARELNDNWLAPGYKVVANEDEATKAAYPWTVEYHHPTYTIAYYDYGAWIDGFEPVTEYTIETETIALPDADDIASRMGGVFQGWTNEVGEVVSEVVQGTTGNLNFYAVWKSGAFIQIPVDSYEDLDERGKVALDAIMLEFGTPAAIKDWADAVYTNGKIPASKLNRSSPELIAIAKRYNIPVLTDGAVVETAQAADGAFVFKIVEEERDVYLFAAKVEKMIKYSDDLTSFAVNTDKVSAQVQDERTIKAVFLKPNNETKGFMKLELPATEE